MLHPQAYKDKAVVILGLAKSGVAVAKLFHGFHANVVVNDKKTRDQCPEADELEALGISVVCGGHPPDLIHPGVALVVKNPGIPYSAEPVQHALELTLPVVTEVEVAYQICAAPIIGITGSNGNHLDRTDAGSLRHEADRRRQYWPRIVRSGARSNCRPCHGGGVEQLSAQGHLVFPAVHCALAQSL